MRQIASVGAGACHHLCIARQHLVEVVDQRLHFLRKHAQQLRRLALVDVVQTALQRTQRPQPDGHLRPRCQRQQHQERRQRQHQHAGKALHRRLGLLQIAGHHQAPTRLRRWRVTGAQGAFQHQQRRAFGPQPFMDVQRAIGQSVSV